MSCIAPFCTRAEIAPAAFFAKPPWGPVPDRTGAEIRADWKGAAVSRDAALPAVRLAGTLRHYHRGGSHGRSRRRPAAARGSRRRADQGAGRPPCRTARAAAGDEPAARRIGRALRRGSGDAVRKKLADVSTGPFWIKLEGLGTLGGNAPHTLYAEADLARGLKDLHTLVGRAVREAGVPLDYQKWTPHVPMARFDALGQHDLKQIMSFLSRRAALSAGPFAVTDFELVALPADAEPEVLESYSLSGRGR